jgi:hypothetical protein
MLSCAEKGLRALRRGKSEGSLSQTVQLRPGPPGPLAKPTCMLRRARDDVGLDISDRVPVLAVYSAA